MKLDLNNKAKIKKYLEHTKTLSLGFGVLFAYLDAYDNSCEIFQNYLCIVPQWKENSFSDLLGEYDEKRFNTALEKMFDKYGNTLEFFYVPNGHIERYTKISGAELIEIIPDFPEYMNDYNDFVNLSWNKCKGKTADYNSFIKNANFEYQSLCENNHVDCVKIMDNWCENRICAECVFNCEKNALRRFLDFQRELDVSGGLVYVNNEPLAFMLCEQNFETVNIYMAKTAKNINGLTVFLYLETIKNEFSNAKYINLGTAQGIEGLTVFKQKFKPFWLNELNTIKIQKAK